MPRNRAALAARLSVRLYRSMLAVYPAGFRRDYGQQMAQVFRDTCNERYAEGGHRGLVELWTSVLIDLALSALRERIAAMTSATNRSAPILEGGQQMNRRSLIGPVLPYVLSIVFGLGISYVNLHTDEVTFVALPLFGVAAVLGFLSPRGAWRWALLLVVWTPLGQWLAYLAGMKLPYPNNEASDILTVLASTSIFAFAGCYSGVLARWLAGKFEGGSAEQTRQ